MQLFKWLKIRLVSCNASLSLPSQAKGSWLKPSMTDRIEMLYNIHNMRHMSGRQVWIFTRAEASRWEPACIGQYYDIAFQFSWSIIHEAITVKFLRFDWVWLRKLIHVKVESKWEWFCKLSYSKISPSDGFLCFPSLTLLKNDCTAGPSISRNIRRSRGVLWTSDLTAIKADPPLTCRYMYWI